jgi:hypothetical protein
MNVSAPLCAKCGPAYKKRGDEIAALRAEVERLRKNFMSACNESDGFKARADSLTVERDGAVRRGLMILDQKEHFRIKADALAVEVERLTKALEEAPHGTALKPCAVDHYDPETYMDDPEPCDCWKARAKGKP